MLPFAQGWVKTMPDMSVLGVILHQNPLVINIGIKGLNTREIVRNRKINFRLATNVFPITEIDFFVPKWAEMLPNDHWLKVDLINSVKEILNSLSVLRDVNMRNFATDSQYVKRFKIDRIEPRDGSVKVYVDFDDQYYYNILSDLIGTEITGEYQFISTLRHMAEKRQEYEKVANACEEVHYKGYGVVTPQQEEISIKEPEVIKHGSKYGVKIKAIAPSIHMIKANIETEIAPIVGSEEQANDLIEYIKENSKDNPDGIWDTNIFGKSIEQLVDDGIKTKISKMNDESQIKLQETLQKIVNDSNGGLICIII